MTTRALPKELVELARALREASAKEPTAAKANAIERKMESLIRQIRAAQKSAGTTARTEREREEIRAQAKEWAAKGPSGDPGRRKRSGYQRFVAAYAKKHKGKKNLLKHAAAHWRGLTAASKAKWGHAKKRKTAHASKKKRTGRDPGWHARSTRSRHTRARRHRARRHQARRRGHRRDPS